MAYLYLFILQFMQLLIIFRRKYCTVPYIYTFSHVFEVKVTFKLQFQIRFGICFTFFKKALQFIKKYFFIQLLMQFCCMILYCRLTHFCPDCSIMNIVCAAYEVLQCPASQRSVAPESPFLQRNCLANHTFVKAGGIFLLPGIFPSYFMKIV